MQLSCWRGAEGDCKGSMAGTASAVPIVTPRSLPGCPCRSLGCSCQRFRSSGTSSLCAACSHHQAFHHEPVATSLQCKWRKLKTGPPPDSELIIGEDGKVVVLWTCGCSDFTAGEGGSPNCVACKHDESFHASVVPPSLPPPCPQPAAPPSQSQGVPYHSIHVDAGGGVASVALSSDVNIQLVTSPQAPTVASQVNVGAAAMGEGIVQKKKRGMSKGAPSSGPEPILASWHDGVQGISSVTHVHASVTPLFNFQFRVCSMLFMVVPCFFSFTRIICFNPWDFGA